MQSLNPTVSTNPMVVVGPNPARTFLSVVNTGAVPVCLAFDTPLGYGSGIYLAANGGTFSMDKSNWNGGQLYAVSTGAGTTLAIGEY